MTLDEGGLKDTLGGPLCVEDLRELGAGQDGRTGSESHRRGWRDEWTDMGIQRECEQRQARVMKIKTRRRGRRQR